MKAPSMRESEILLEAFSKRGKSEADSSFVASVVAETSRAQATLAKKIYPIVDESYAVCCVATA